MTELPKKAILMGYVNINLEHCFDLGGSAIVFDASRRIADLCKFEEQPDYVILISEAMGEVYSSGSYIGSHREAFEQVLTREIGNRGIGHLKVKIEGFGTNIKSMVDRLKERHPSIEFSGLTGLMDRTRRESDHTGRLRDPDVILYHIRDIDEKNNDS